MSYALDPVLWRPFRNRPHLGLAAALFGLLWAFGAQLGPTDDEAYYWVLAQNLSSGYAFHPPGGPLLIRTAQELFHSLLNWQPNSLASLRFFAALLSSISFYLLADSLRFANQRTTSLRDSLLLLGFAGGWASGWMMVPDIPLFLGFSLTWWATHRLLRGQEKNWHFMILALGCFIGMLGKFSGVFISASAFAALAFSFFERKDRKLAFRATSVILFATLLGFAPSLWWNLIHDWSGFLYHLKDRHQAASGEGIHIRRWFLFVATQVAVAGPILVVSGTQLFGRTLWGVFQSAITKRKKPERFTWVALLFALPPFLIYGLVPLWGDFKPHWMLIAWLPLLLALIPQWNMSIGIKSPGNYHLAWGITATAILWTNLLFHVPAWIASISNMRAVAPKTDITNDLYGWAELRGWWKNLPHREKLPWVGARYQTASQVAFALENSEEVTLLPRSLLQRDEWPDLRVTETENESPLRIIEPFYFFATDRYPALPPMTGGLCESEKILRIERLPGVLAREMRIYRCSPDAPSERSFQAKNRWQQELTPHPRAPSVGSRGRSNEENRTDVSRNLVPSRICGNSG